MKFNKFGKAMKIDTKRKLNRNKSIKKFIKKIMWRT
jgi:hypothetical protein